MLANNVSICRPNSRFKLQDKTETDRGPLGSSDNNNYLTSKYSSFESRKNIFTKDTPTTPTVTVTQPKPLFRRNWKYQSIETETDICKVDEKDHEKDYNNSNEITGKSRVDAEARNINELENDKSVSEESKQIIQKSLDGKSDGDESNENVIKSKSSDNGRHAENHEIETQTGNISAKISSKNSVRRPAKCRKSERRNKCRGQDEAVTVSCRPKADPDPDPLNSVEIQSAAQWKAISQRVSWKSREASLDTEETEETGEKCGGRRSRSSVDLSDRCDR